MEKLGVIQEYVIWIINVIGCAVVYQNITKRLGFYFLVLKTLRVK